MTGLDRIIDIALAEDIHTGDLTTRAILTGNERLSGILLAKEPLVLAGIDVAAAVFRRLDPGSEFTAFYRDGAEIAANITLARVVGSAAALLEGERVALNLLQRLSGIATITARFVAAVTGTGARVVDTRKTTPGLRLLEKYAVRVGGGSNHRFGLYDGVLIKENHITAAGGISAAISRCRATVPHMVRIEVETENLDQVTEALEAGADVIMLDNMGLDEMRRAVTLVGGRVPLEASGGVTLETILSIAKTGVDIISVGGLTHSARAMDISMLLEEC